MVDINRTESGLQRPNVPPSWYTPRVMIEQMDEDQLREFAGVLNERISLVYAALMKMATGDFTAGEIELMLNPHETFQVPER